MPLQYVKDSRRLTGRTILLERPGAVLEVEPPGVLARRMIARWQREARKLCDAIGWRREAIAARWFAPTAHLALTAPIDQLLAATLVAEWAWELTLTALTGHRTLVFDAIVERLTRRLERNAQSALVRFHREALRRRAQLLIGDRDLSIGEGSEAEVYAFDAVPSDPGAIDWARKRHRLPTALVTGTNGKTTTVRLLARMCAEAGFRTGFCCTDSVEVAGEVLDRDDYSGPGGTRKVLRHPHTEAAVLEVARGGLLRRGLGVRDAEVAIVTNVADDHLHDMGVHTLKQMAEVKFLIATGLAARAPLVTNAENAWCRAEVRRLARPTIWFALEPPPASLLKRTSQLCGLATLRDGAAVWEAPGRQRVEVCAADAMPFAARGAAPHNLANALAAIGAAMALGLPVAAQRSALQQFGTSNADNPGRSNRYLIGGATVIADFGHNAEALRAVFTLARGLPRERLLISLGQAGDRDDAAIRALGALAAAEHPDCVILKDMPKYRRGREAGAIPALMREGLADAGVADEAVVEVEGDREALAHTLAWLGPGDLALLFVHSDTEAVLADLAERAKAAPTA
jgi:UDP-N-acetylmuramyl tripeptide synthase